MTKTYLNPASTLVPTSFSTSANLATHSSNSAEHEPRQKIGKRRTHHETLIPGIYNPGIEKFISKATQGFKTPTQSTAEIVKSELKKRWGIDVDPDNTFIVTLNYDPKKPKPKNGKVLNKISLTQAALHNAQRANKEDEHQTSSEKRRSTLHTWLGRLAPALPLPAAIDQIDTLIHQQKTYEGIHVRPQPGQPETYNHRTLLSKSPEGFRSIVWDTDFSKPYTQFLNGFWPAHERKYEQLSKASFLGGALRQFENDSLSESDTDLAMRAAGLPSNTTWEKLKLDDLSPATTKNPEVEVGLLSINGYKSTDLLYITDKKSRVDADGKPVNRTLLYIPGNSSPIHSFNSQAEMKNWLAEQAADPVKREALSMHFSLRDQANRFFSDGVNQTLVGLSGWPRKNAPDAGPLERLNEFDPQKFITAEPLSTDPFTVMTQRQKERSYADAETEITTDGDVTKTTILEALETTTKIALMMTPLAFVMPEVAVGLEIFYAAAGAAEAGIGADDLKHGKPGGADHIVFGVLNALPVAAGKANNLIKGEQKAITTVGENIEDTIKVQDAEAPEPPIVEPPSANRLKPTEAANISQYAVPNGEQLIEGATRNSKGIYQVKTADGEDQWFIRYTDATDVPRVFAIKGNFKLSNGYVQIIDRETSKPVMTVHAKADGEWAQGLGPGGKWPWTRASTPPIDNVKTTSRLSDAFVDLEGKKLEGAEQIDEYLYADDNLAYEYSIRNIEENGVVKTKIGMSWDLAEENFEVAQVEKAGPSDFSTNAYSEQFIKDLSRFNYSVVVKNGKNEVRTVLKSAAEDGLEKTAERLRQFEQLIPDPELRTRISEVAHQGSLAPASNYLNQDSSGLKSGFYLGGKDTEIVIEYDASAKSAKVNFTSTNTVSQPDTERYKIPEVEITTKRTFAITESNEINNADNVYVVGKHAPSNVEFTLVLK